MSQNRSSDRTKPATTIERERRLAEALRENLKKRKAQARGQAGEQAQPAEKPRPGAGDKPRRG